MAKRTAKPITPAALKTKDAKNKKSNLRIQTAEGWKRSQYIRRKLAK